MINTSCFWNCAITRAILYFMEVQQCLFMQFEKFARNLWYQERNRFRNKDNCRIFFSGSVLCFRVSSIKLQRLLAWFPLQVGAISFLAPGKINFQTSAGSTWKFCCQERWTHSTDCILIRKSTLIVNCNLYATHDVTANIFLFFTVAHLFDENIVGSVQPCSNNRLLYALKIHYRSLHLSVLLI